ncbi:MAG: UDP-galactose transporter [Peltula sp. TS41687]|nr:MAG: UDP-galactose transporter [Peltula sp. TS41687]
MARQKQTTPSSSTALRNRRELNRDVNRANAQLEREQQAHLERKAAVVRKPAGLTEFLVCVGGIYASFLSWAVLQERITTTPYGPTSSPEMFRYPIFLNTIQSLFAALTGYIYLFLTIFHTGLPSILPDFNALPPLLLVSITSSLASPFGYASLKHIDYITFILAKSCKLLPVMLLHLTVFRKRYPLYKYAVVALVTTGVAIFTLHHPSSAKSKKQRSSSTSSSSQQPRDNLLGLTLLAINLLFDGLTNSTQDYIFATFRAFTGPQMMCVQNLLNTCLTAAYMFLLQPFLARRGVSSVLGMNLATDEYHDAMAFIARNPEVRRDILSFAACGAVGQIFISENKVYTLSHFSSLLLVTVTVTRKMLTMILSVIWFGHRLTGFQWLGVGLVFSGVGAEGYIQKREKQTKEKEKDRGKKAM